MKLLAEEWKSYQNYMCKKKKVKQAVWIIFRIRLLNEKKSLPSLGGHIIRLFLRSPCFSGSILTVLINELIASSPAKVAVKKKKKLRRNLLNKAL